MIAAIKPEDARWILIFCTVLVVVLIVGFLAVCYYRRRLLKQDDSSSKMWTLDDLRRMRAEGSLSEEEYQALRGAMIGSFKADVRTKPPAQGAAEAAKGGSDDTDFDVEKGLRA